MLKKYLLSAILLIVSVLCLRAEDSLRVSACEMQMLFDRISLLEQAQQSASPQMAIDAQSGASIKLASSSDAQHNQSMKTESKGRFTLGGYGEAAMKRCFYSNNYLRYTSPDKYKDDQYGEFDLPHIVIYMGYDFGKGWSMGSEIEFEHGGVEAAVEIEEEEGGEYESEVERGGEVALEQFWLQKTFNPYANLRAGMLIVPLGGTNAHHEPNHFFGVYRPEGDNTILPCTWHDIGIQIHGRWQWVAYLAQFLPGLESDLFGAKNWIHYGSASPYEFKLSNCYAGLLRLDFYPLAGKNNQYLHPESLRISASGYAGTSFRNNLTPTSNAKYKGVNGLIGLASLDWCYSDYHLIFRGSATYGHLNDAEKITAFNKQMSSNSVSKRQVVASDAYTAGAEIGYDFFHFNKRLSDRHQQFYLFARYDIYDAQAAVVGSRSYWTGRQKVSCGFNYFPMPQIVIKGEWGYGILNQNPYTESRYNNEPYIALSINYAGMFKL